MKSRIALTIVLALFLNSGAVVQAETNATIPDMASSVGEEPSATENIIKDYKKLEKDLMAEQKELNDKWSKYIKQKKARLQEIEDAASKVVTQSYTLKDKLVHVAEKFMLKDALKEIWGDISDYFKTIPKDFTINFDTENQIIHLMSDEVDAKGRPLLEYEINKQTGHTVQTRRMEDGSETYRKEKDINLDQFAVNMESKYKPAITKQEPGQPASLTTATLNEGTLDIVDEWNDLEKQRDLAFKIMWFFMIFIVFTFGLIYAFFKMTQSEEHQAEIRKQKMEREASKQGKQDFLNIHNLADVECNVINPYQAKLPTKVTSQFTSSAMPFTNLAEISYHKAQQLKQRSLSNSFNDNVDTTITSERDSQRFDASNPYHQSQEDEQNFSNQNVDYQLLSNMYASQNGY